MKTLAMGLDRLSARIDHIAMAFAVAALGIMLGAALWQTVARYIFDSPPIWTEELARRAMVWAGMLGASCAFRAGANPVLFPAMLAIRGGTGVVLSLLRAAGVVVFVGPVLWFCIFAPGMNVARGFLGRSLERQAEMLGVPMIWFTAAVPVALAIILIHMLAVLASELAGRDDTAHADKTSET
ncbi:TRAP transporter small permease [Aquibium microcysteis]|uniref:TRAP transporter small permease n=1 Tax=Aquibium microcysteis TaxID=675281 RepID=UPI00165D142D|nr:TRAP transporter small permease subunit [Aquibium microcysteis]